MMKRAVRARPAPIKPSAAVTPEVIAVVSSVVEIAAEALPTIADAIAANARARRIRLAVFNFSFMCLVSCVLCCAHDSRDCDISSPFDGCSDHQNDEGPQVSGEGQGKKFHVHGVKGKVGRVTEFPGFSSQDSFRALPIFWIPSVKVLSNKERKRCIAQRYALAQCTFLVRHHHRAQRRGRFHSCERLGS